MLILKHITNDHPPHLIIVGDQDSEGVAIFGLNPSEIKAVCLYTSTEIITFRDADFKNDALQDLIDRAGMRETG